jgi:hypothetical protein
MAPSVEAVDSRSESRPRRSAVDSSRSSSTLLSVTPAFSAAESRPEDSMKLRSFFSSSLSGGVSLEDSVAARSSLLQVVALLLLAGLEEAPVRAQRRRLPLLVERVHLAAER